MIYPFKATRWLVFSGASPISMFIWGHLQLSDCASSACARWGGHDTEWLLRGRNIINGRPGIILRIFTLRQKYIFYWQHWECITVMLSICSVITRAIKKGDYWTMNNFFIQTNDMSHLPGSWKVKFFCPRQVSYTKRSVMKNGTGK